MSVKAWMTELSAWEYAEQVTVFICERFWTAVDTWRRYLMLCVIQQFAFWLRFFIQTYLSTVVGFDFIVTLHSYCHVLLKISRSYRLRICKWGAVTNLHDCKWNDRCTEAGTQSVNKAVEGSPMALANRRWKIRWRAADSNMIGRTTPEEAINFQTWVLAK